LETPFKLLPKTEISQFVISIAVFNRKFGSNMKLARINTLLCRIANMCQTKTLPLQYQPLTKSLIPAIIRLLSEDLMCLDAPQILGTRREKVQDECNKSLREREREREERGRERGERGRESARESAREGERERARARE
jgi:hypothetical protein